MPHVHPRRVILCRLLTRAMVALGVPAAIAGEADPHPAWLAEWEALVEWCNDDAPADRDLVDCPEWHRSLELEELIGFTPARTPAGALCQLRVLRQWCTGPYGAAATRMVAAALSDVVLMRAAERARPRLPEAAEPSPEQEPVVLQQMTNLLRDMTTLFGEQQEELRRLHGERKEEPAAA